VFQALSGFEEFQNLAGEFAMLRLPVTIPPPSSLDWRVAARRVAQVLVVARHQAAI
jgi:hypothetical protein